VPGYTRETIEFAVHEDLPLLSSLEPPETRQLILCRELCAANAPSYDASRHSLNRYVCIGASQAEADRLVDTLLPRLHERRRKFAARRGESPGTLAPRKRADFLREQAVAELRPSACGSSLLRSQSAPTSNSLLSPSSTRGWNRTPRMSSSR
jgi:hypothetical protein